MYDWSREHILLFHNLTEATPVWYQKNPSFFTVRSVTV